MKKLLLFSFISILFFSCSNVSEVQQVVAESTEPTLKEIVVSKEADISWTKELEGSRLLQYIYTDNEHISSDIALTPDVVSVSFQNEDPVYPSITNFGTLDTTNIPTMIKSTVDDFCKAFSDNVFQGPQAYFDSDCIFNYIFFRNDLIKNWKTKFGVDFPQNKNNEDSDENDKKEKNKPLFYKWIIGSCFNGEEIVRLPVRFCCKQGYVDVTLYVNKSTNKIYQILEGPYDGKK